MSASETLAKDEQLSELVSCRQSCKDMLLSIFGHYLLQTKMQPTKVIEFSTENEGQYIHYVSVTTNKKEKLNLLQ